MDVDIGAARILLDVTTMSNLAEQRFYAAKSEPITAVTPLTQAPVEGGTLMIARVERPSGSDVYQLLLDAAGNDPPPPRHSCRHWQKGSPPVLARSTRSQEKSPK